MHDPVVYTFQALRETVFLGKQQTDTVTAISRGATEQEIRIHCLRLTLMATGHK